MAIIFDLLHHFYNLNLYQNMLSNMNKEWKDEKLIWDRRDYDGTDNIRIPCRRLWLPDIVLYNR
jgi:hypothetical protein